METWKGLWPVRKPVAGALVEDSTPATKRVSEDSFDEAARHREINGRRARRRSWLDPRAANWLQKSSQ